MRGGFVGKLDRTDEFLLLTPSGGKERTLTTCNEDTLCETSSTFLDVRTDEVVLEFKILDRKWNEESMQRTGIDKLVTKNDIHWYCVV